MILEEGRIVKAMAGRDKGKFFFVLKTEGNFAYIADGKSRKIQKPKKKNCKHLQGTAKKCDITDMTNSRARDCLRQWNQ